MARPLKYDCPHKTKTISYPSCAEAEILAAIAKICKKHELKKNLKRNI